ncbi:MAG: glycosyltransferase family 2 protein [Nitrospira sp.]
MDELVSIIIPAYNAERWVGETIRSALSQTWPRKEIVIVDDGSTDETLAIARRYESKLVKVVTQKNSGVSAARNRGLTFAQGSYIQWLDADDLLAPDKISHQLKSAERGKDSRTLLTSSFGTFYFCRERAKVSPSVLWQDLSPVEWLLNKFNDNLWMNPATWLVSRKLTELSGPWNERLVRDNDGEYICRVVAASENIRFVREAMSYYRTCNFGSLSNSWSEKAQESLGQSLGLCTGYLLALENSERTRRACVNYLQSFMPFFYPEGEGVLHKVQALASQLGGQLTVPQVSWKRALLSRIIGSKTTKKVMIRCAKTKFKAVIQLDRLLCGMLHEAH